MAPAGTLVVEYRELPNEGAWGSLEGLASWDPVPVVVAGPKGLEAPAWCQVCTHTHRPADQLVDTGWFRQEAGSWGRGRCLAGDSASLGTPLRLGG